MKSRPVFYYFAFQGRGESVRVMLDFLKIEYEEVHVPSPLLGQDKEF